MSKINLKAELYRDKDEVYFSDVRWDIIQFVPNGSHKILDVGCGAGNTLIKLKELGKANEVVGIEIDEKAIQGVPDTLDKLHVGDAETIDLPYTDKYFDYILFADALEHFINPWRALHKYKSLLKDGGYIIASVPNIKNYYILKRLIFHDEFRYSDWGTLDRSHLRFFTKKEIIKLLKDENLEVTNLIYLPVRTKAAKKAGKVTFSSGLLNKSSFFAKQYLIKARKEGS
jgi:2-polyprenyl-3-methyl-5-hydroxy-6-metoxy-1,4-benzoquinol methylase